MASKIRQEKRAVFKEIVREPVTPVFVAKISANRRQTIDILKENGLVPITYREALININQNQQLREELKGKWFWVAGKRMDIEEGSYTFDRKGIGKESGDPEQTFFFYSGIYKLHLEVRDDKAVYGPIDSLATGLHHKQRFILGAYRGPTDEAPIIVGIRDPTVLKEQERRSPIGWQI